ncbi:hypothetical protein S7711_03291 [Stachybotrys chartarum IBT 7711]|uniref:Uncharacterized protein n=1 Tax=Stachybotrys chartarum (strain CBS 109288 / IBT 7711) TaxID=1280523 RepID=A0A084AUK5_STACB|nr:hypothetical protein S7711_03291 [Stachybotrys chartarum IBT 7711]
MVPTWKPEYRELGRNELAEESKRWAMPAWTRDDDDDEVEDRGFFERMRLRKKADRRLLSSITVPHTTRTLLARQDQGTLAPPPPPQTTGIPSGSESGDESSNSSTESSRRPAPTRPPAPLTSSSLLPASQGPIVTLPEQGLSSSAPIISLPSELPSATGLPGGGLRITTLVPPPPPPPPSSTSTSSASSSSPTSTSSASSSSPTPNFETIANSPLSSTHLAHATAGATSTSTVAPATESADRKQVVEPPPYGRRHGPNAAERAVHILGAIGGVFFIIGLIWFLWRTFKKSRTARKRGKQSFTRHRIRLAVPFFHSRSQSDTPNVDDSYPTAFEEKQMAEQAQRDDASSLEAKMYPEHYQTDQTMDSVATLPPAYAEKTRLQYLTDNILSHVPKHSLSSNTAEYGLGNTLRTEGPYTSKRSSEISSLSSAFGDQDIIVPVSAESTLREQTMTRDEIVKGLPPPPPVRRESLASRMSRITLYTESSDDSPPRFRTVNSWVRQQTGRITRQNKRAEEEDVPPVPSLPAEPEFVMMMPDGEEPRRVDMNQTDSSNKAVLHYI